MLDGKIGQLYLYQGIDWACQRINLPVGAVQPSNATFTGLRPALPRVQANDGLPPVDAGLSRQRHASRAVDIAPVTQGLQH
jgi:hypothetical protein